MALHLIPFVAGAAVGSMAAYFLRDKKVVQGVKDVASKVSSKASDSVSSLRSHKPVEEKTVEDKKKTVRKARTPAKTTSAKRSPAPRKTAASRKATTSSKTAEAQDAANSSEPEST